MPCPEPDRWSELADPARREELEQHLDTCAACRELVAALTRDPDAAVWAPELAVAGAQIGRYVVEGPLGAGGMGVVLAAHDPQLDRVVALKLVRILERSPAAIERARARLVAEAKAMARVQHPNVVVVHEVVEAGDHLVLAMECVDGSDLGAWLADARRSRAERLRVVIDAGRGLAAAHAAGVVHRDVKPANILVGRDGRARLTDLGLAAVIADLDAPLARLGRGSESRLVGTPGYLAPEVVAGGSGDARSDQFAFAVTARSVLFGSARPRGRLAKLLARASADDPDARFPTMAALVDALGHRPRWPAMAVAAGAAIAIVVAAWWHEPVRAASCTADVTAGGAWTPLRRAMLGGALGTRDTSPEHQLSVGVLALADARSRAWSDAVVDTCRARERGTQIGEPADRRGACLEDQRRELDTALAAAQSATPARALGSIAHLPEPSICDRAAPVPTDAEHVRVRAELTAIAALSAGAHFNAARARADALAPTVTDPGLAASVAYRRADLALRAGNAAAALPLAHEAVSLAERAHDDSGRLQAMMVLVSILDELGRATESQALAPVLEAAAGRQPLDDAHRAHVENILGNVTQTAGNYADAERHYRAALAATEREYAGVAAPEVAGSLQNLAAVLNAEAKPDDARALLARSIAMFEATVGPEHPDLAIAVNELGSIELEADHYDAAAKLFERGLAIRTHALGPDHPYLSESLALLARVEHDRGHDDRALELYRHALANARAGFGPDHPLTALAAGHIAEILQARGQTAEALELAEAAVKTWDATGTVLPDAFDARFVLAELVWPTSHARARKLAEAARAAYAAMPAPYNKTATTIAAWLAGHR